ncbi:MAG: tRNA (adenosine(37)-N6)-dimethylallyltransferase MiaA [Puniceicoccales bacterium]|jgi:tRNA dimethylallyltransferase|nr:tRNA (adenosine(37)-N6)-dimethylallyltransferase MiaA [Puniceicoccales bacterium]
MEASTLWIITGCTAIGKTALSIRLAQKFSAEILSCDSLNFYRGMDIGTAKPVPRERVGVPHHGIDLCDISETYDVERYQRDALTAVKNIQNRGHPVLIVGGSGFYLQSFYRAVIDDIFIPKSIQAYVSELFCQEGLPGIVEELLKISPKTGALDLRNPRRVLRALSRCLASGHNVLELQELFLAKQSLFHAWPKRTCLLTRNPENLRNRAAQRIDDMITRGLIEEVQQLQCQGLRFDSPAGQAIGYRETLHWLQTDRRDIAALKDPMLQNTLHLIRKQRTWFRHQIPIDWILNLDLHSEEESFDILSTFFQ